MVERPDGKWQEVRPSCCMNMHPWDRPGSFRLAGAHVRAWECATCGNVVTVGGPAKADGYPLPSVTTQ